MNPKALKTLEYNKIIDKLTEFAGSALAKEMCRNLQPSTDLYEIQALQKETSDALSRIYQKGAVSFRGVRDIRGSIKRLEIGAIIGINVSGTAASDTGFFRDPQMYRLGGGIK